MRQRSRRVAIGFLQRVLPDDEPLIGDLAEESMDRSDTWFWRQVLYVALTRTIHSIWMNSRVTIGGVLVALAILVLAGFEAVVAASLAIDLFGLHDMALMPPADRQQAWLTYSMSMFVAAVALGRFVNGFHTTNRIAAVLVCGGSATAAAVLNLWLIIPQPVMSFMPAQIAISMVFVVGLFAGAGWRSLCDPASSS
jgi:hypothetical protein